jgi:hypothetical protein
VGEGRGGDSVKIPVSLPRSELDTSQTEVKSITASADLLGKGFHNGITTGLCPSS